MTGITPQGTVAYYRFEATLPSSRNVSIAESPAQTGVPVRTILVVEDFEVVRAIVVRTLREAGYTVLEAQDGEAAWDILVGPDRIHMLVTDIAMPRLGGIQLSHRLAASGKPLPLLFISGYDQNPADVPGALLPKPFTPDQLVTEVRKILPTAQ